ncbi:MAG TPA: hypothetical protein VI653_17410, partial [Steroidobacteraceae bacterium]
ADPFYSAVASAVLIASALFGRPMSYAGARTIVAGGSEARLAAYERTPPTCCALQAPDPCSEL